MSTPIPHPAAPTPTLTELIRRRALLRADAEYIANEIAVIDAQILEQLPNGTHDVDGVKVQVRQSTRYDYAALADQYPADQYPGLYVTETKIDAASVKAQFAPAALDEFKRLGTRSVITP